MAPAGLDKGDAVIGKVGDGGLEDVRLRAEVSIEDEEEFPLGNGIGSLEGPGLKARAVRAVQAYDVEALLAVELHLLLAEVPSVIRGVIQNLNFQLILGVIDSRHLAQQALHHELLIEHGELHGHVGPLLPLPLGPGKVLAVDEVEEEHHEPVEAIACKADEHQEVGDQPNEAEPGKLTAVGGGECV